MESLKAEIVHREPAIPMGLTLAEYITSYADAIGSAANKLARSFLLPDTLRITAADNEDQKAAKVRDVGVLIARALSTREDIMALAQSIYLVGGRPALSAAYLVARAQQIGAIRGAPRYRTEGVWPEISVTATVKTADGEEHEATVSMQEAREDGWAGRNQKYKTHRPAENMLHHRASARLMRRVAPGVVLGMAVAEEVMDQQLDTVAPVRASVAPRTLVPALSDNGPVRDYVAEAEALAARERVAADPEPLPREATPAAPTTADEAVEPGTRRRRGWKVATHVLGWSDVDRDWLDTDSVNRICDEGLRKGPWISTSDHGIAQAETVAP